jgi:hypothetical protein
MLMVLGSPATGQIIPCISNPISKPEGKKFLCRNIKILLFCVVAERCRYFCSNRKDVDIFCI